MVLSCNKQSGTNKTVKHATPWTRMNNANAKATRCRGILFTKWRGFFFPLHGHRDLFNRPVLVSTGSRMPRVCSSTRVRNQTSATRTDSVLNRVNCFRLSRRPSRGFNRISLFIVGSSIRSSCLEANVWFRFPSVCVVPRAACRTVPKRHSVFFSFCIFNVPSANNARFHATKCIRRTSDRDCKTAVWCDWKLPIAGHKNIRQSAAKRVKISTSSCIKC